MIKHRSSFKDPAKDIAWFEKWVSDFQSHNNRKYGRTELKTSLGRTHVWSLNDDRFDLDTLVIFPGARTTSLFWDFNRNLDNLGVDLRIFLIETNGLPNLSDGDSPDIKSLDYGHWANEVLNGLAIDKAWVAGASFGGLIAMKLAITNPEKIKAAFLLNPGCLQSFSMSWNNLYYNLLPIIRPSKKNVRKFLEKAIFSKPNHQLEGAAEKLIVDYEVFAISRYNDKTQKPYFMGDQLKQVKADTYLLEGDKDLLFPVQKSIDNAKKLIPTLKDVKVFSKVGHGIETYDKAMNYIGQIILNS